ncbi:alpha/beta hydrolase [Cyclobacteriaceae bacterium]|jgi:pimeloyl-ACP methyl ester carboxylesterase|nr:alpha/beta hydrolase [bacterium]MDC1516256.1 alpha/beta hydrolase [Cyclobacteriaceae bacterium]|tara:strand:+ start:32 stop:844 length:813 start_codon:yes stop_codon:yes gene_type:complete
MFAETKKIIFEKYSLAYNVSGNSELKLLLFHGFGQDRTAFDLYHEKLLGFEIYSFDLVFHGESTGPEKKLSPNDWFTLMSMFIKKEQIKNFYVAGFSLGGKFALFLAIYFPTHVSQLILIAPDGFYKSPWYLISTTWPTRLLFNYLTQNFKQFHFLMGALKYMGLIDVSMSRFIHKELSTKDALKKVYRSWTYFRDISFSSKLLKLFLAQSSHIHVFLGAKDPLIRMDKITPVLTFETYTVLKEKHHKIPVHPAVLAYIQNLETNPHKKA